MTKRVYPMALICGLIAFSEPAGAQLLGGGLSGGAGAMGGAGFGSMGGFSGGASAMGGAGVGAMGGFSGGAGAGFGSSFGPSFGANAGAGGMTGLGGSLDTPRAGVTGGAASLPPFQYE